MIWIRESSSWTNWRAVLIIGLVCIIAVLVGWLTAALQFGARELVIFILAAVAIGLVVVPTERTIGFGFALWILTFGFGWRTIHLTSFLSIHPAEVLAWLLFGLVMLYGIIRRVRLDFSIPRWIPVLMIFSGIGVLTAVAFARSAELFLREAKGFWVIIPIYYIVQWIITDRVKWERAMWLGIGVAVYVSLLGWMDFFTPALSQALTGVSNAKILIVSPTQGDFERAGFAFYGSPAAGLMIFTFFGLSVYNLLDSTQGQRRYLILNGAVVAIQLVAMYLSGYRGVYYATLILVMAYALMQRKIWALAVGAIAVLPLLPSAFFQRFTSLWDWRYADSSQFSRMQRASDALDLVYQYPLFGVGWGGSGYVHSDFIQIAANLGLPAGIVFLLWLLTLIWKMFQLRKNSDWTGRYAVAVFATLCGLMIILAGEGLLAQVHLAIPIWFMLAMAYKLTHLAAQGQATA